MALRPRRSNFRTQPSFRPVYEDFQPWSEMTENQEARVLHIQLPGFTKERIRFQFEDSSRMLKVSGERPIVGGNRRSRFKEAYSVPQNCDVDKIQSNFYEGTLTITMPKKLISQAEVKTTQEKARSRPKKSEEVVPPKSAREEEPRDKKRASSPSSSGKRPDDMNAQKSQEETPSQRPVDSQKPEKELRAMIPSEVIKGEKGQVEILQKPRLTMTEAPDKQADGKPQKVQEETEPKPTLKMVPIKPTDEEPQKDQEEIELKPKITTAATQENERDDKTQKVQEETEPKPTLKMDPGKPADGEPQKGQEGTKQNAALTSVPGKQADEKTAARRDKDAEKERVSNKEIIEGKPSESRKPENGVVEKSTVTEKEIRARRELAKADELSVPKTPEKEKETTSKAATAAAVSEWNLNGGMIDTIGKGIKEVTASASQAFTRIAEGKWDDEDKPLLLNVGASILVLAAMGIYAFYRFSSSERT